MIMTTSNMLGYANARAVRCATAEAHWQSNTTFSIDVACKTTVGAIMAICGLR
jgi:hypothetical protein